MHRPSILILPFHGIGHFNALFGVARALGKTHNVVFAGTGYFHKHVASHGFPYISLMSQPFGIGLEDWLREESKHPRLYAALDRWRDKLYHQRKSELTSLLNDLKPVHVLVDSQQATDLIVVKSIDPNVRISLVTNTPPYLLLPGLPPVNSLAMPGDNDDELREKLTAIKTKRWKQRWKYFGIDDRMIVDRRLRRNKLQHLKDDCLSLITFAAKNVDHYVLTYKNYDFHHPHLDRFRYVGPHPDRESLQINPSEKKLIYCALGTVPSGKNVDAFFEKVRKAAADLDCEIIIGTLRNFVNQSEVLSRAHVFITHGGINSIHDAIHYNVPMIVYPVDMNYDQQGNSSRVVYHGFGLRGNFDQATADDIRSKLVEIFADIRFKKNLEAFDTSGYDIDSFVKMII
ncbi:MAG: glycosyltransferase [Bacteroidota bacterium]